MNIIKDMLKDVTAKAFVLYQHDIEANGETKTHWDIRIQSDDNEYSLTSNPIDGNDILAIKKRIRPIPESMPNKVTEVDHGNVNIIEENDKTTFVFGGQDLKGTWTGTRDNTCIIPNTIRLKRENDVA